MSAAIFRVYILVAAVLFSFLGLPVLCKIERFVFRVQETGTTVNEEVDVDPAEQTEVIRVPKHNDVDASDVLNDFANGLSVRRVPSTMDCYLSKLDPSIPSPQKMKLDLEQASRQTLPDKATVRKTTTRVLGLAIRSQLPQKILDFCGSFPIYKVEEIPLDSLVNATFHKTEWQGKTGRKKRNHVQMMYHLCSHSDEQQLEYCLNKLGGFNFRQRCTYKTAHCYYIVDCSHNTNSYNRQYTCNSIVHRLNVRDICCRAIC